MVSPIDVDDHRYTPRHRPADAPRRAHGGRGEASERCGDGGRDAAALDLHRELTEAVGEIERLRAHNARMAAQINRLAEGCGRAARHRDPSYPAIGHIITTLPGECAGQDWADLFAAAEVALGRLAAGEVDDG